MHGAGALSPSSHGEVSWAFWLKEDEGRDSVLPEYRRVLGSISAGGAWGRYGRFLVRRLK